MNPLGRVIGVPAELIAGLRVLPRLARDMEKVREATECMPDVRQATTDMERHTRSLPEVVEALNGVGKGTELLGPMDKRMETIEGAMPVLVEVQQHLAQLPETMEKLDRGVAEMAEVLERLLVSMQELNGTLHHLDGSVGPLGRLAGRLPGGGKREREATETAGEPPPPDAETRVGDVPAPTDDGNGGK